jgi:hypothetical protein
MVDGSSVNLESARRLRHPAGVSPMSVRGQGSMSPQRPCAASKAAVHFRSAIIGGLRPALNSRRSSSRNKTRATRSPGGALKPVRSQYARFPGTRRCRKASMAALRRLVEVSELRERLKKNSAALRPADRMEHSWWWSALVEEMPVWDQVRQRARKTINCGRRFGHGDPPRVG